MVVKINAMPKHHRDTGLRTFGLRPIYVSACPDCQNTRRITKVHHNGMKHVVRCVRCTVIR